MQTDPFDADSSRHTRRKGASAALIAAFALATPHAANATPDGAPGLSITVCGAPEVVIPIELFRKGETPKRPTNDAPAGCHAASAVIRSKSLFVSAKRKS